MPRPFFLFCSLFPLLIGCKTERCENISVSQEMKDYAFFKAGTWWLIQNDSTLVLDTVYVLTSGHTIYEGCGYDPPRRVESYGNVVQGEITSGSIQIIEYINGRLQRFQSSSFWGNFDPTGRKFPVHAWLPNMVVNGKTYQNVAEVKTDTTETRYYALHSFCIKSINHLTGESFSLVDAHILQ